jgi:hypothetical protein
MMECVRSTRVEWTYKAMSGIHVKVVVCSEGVHRRLGIIVCGAVLVNGPLPLSFDTSEAGLNVPTNQLLRHAKKKHTHTHIHTQNRHPKVQSPLTTTQRDAVNIALSAFMG